MIKKLLLLYTVCFSLMMKSQTISMSFFDDKGRLTYEATSYYYRQSTDTVNFYRSFYSKTKNKYFEGKIINSSDSMDYNNKYQGLCKWYHPNGKLKTECQYNDLGILDGKKKEFDTNGKLFKEFIYENGKIKDKKYVEFDSKDNQIDVFDEDFFDNTINWILPKNDSSYSKIRIGGLDVNNRTNSNYAVFYKNGIDSTNFSIETTINSNYLTPEARIGFVFGFKDWNNYDYFFISKLKSYVGSIKNGVKFEDNDSYFSISLKSIELNKLKVVSVNDSFYYYINNVIQMSCYKGKQDGNQIGLYVKQGFSLFDNLVIKQFQNNYNEVLDKEKLTITYLNKMFPVIHFCSGLVINEKGYILTSIKNTSFINKVLIYISVNDTIKEYNADVIDRNKENNFAIIKIKNFPVSDYNKPVYSYSYTRNVDSEKNNIIYRLSDYKSIYTHDIDILNEDSRKITTHKHSDNMLYKTHSCIGSPIFDKSGNILGLIDDVSPDFKIKVLNMQHATLRLIHFPGVFNIQRMPVTDHSIIPKTIYKNLVMIKVF